MTGKKVRKLIDQVMFGTLTCLFIYALWYQFVFRTVPNLFLVLGGTLGICSIARIKRKIGYYKYLFGIGGFAVLAMLPGLLFAIDRSTTMDLLIKHYEYLIIAWAIYTYIGRDMERFIQLLWAMLVPIVLVALWSVLNGVKLQGGSIVAGTMNANVQSSLMSIAVVICFILMNREHSGRLEKVILIAVLALCFVSQIMCASRRGIIVFAFLLVTCLLAVVQVRYKNVRLAKGLLLFAILLAGVWIANEFMSRSDSLLVVERLMTRNSLGDMNRARYQAMAMELFCSSPLFGTGFGSVAVRVGVYSHSLYFELLACTGIVGAALMLGTLFKSFLVFYRAGKSKQVLQQSENAIMMRCMTLFIASIFISGYAVVFIYDMYFYVMLGFVCSMRHIVGSPRRKNRRRRLV